MQRFILPALRSALASIGAPDNTPLKFDKPRLPGHGDLAVGVALELAGALGVPPIDIARRIVDAIRVDSRYVASIEVATPGFINIRLTPAAFHLLLEEADAAGPDYCRLTAASETSARVRSSTLPPVTLHDLRTSVVSDVVVSILCYCGRNVVLEGLSQRGTIIVEHDTTDEVPAERIIQPGMVRLVTPKGAVEGETPAQISDEFDSGLLRYFLLLRPSGMPIVFDPAAVRRNSRSNPYWHVQYAHARIAAIERHADEAGIRGDPQALFTTVVSPKEMSLVRTIIQLPEVLNRATRECEPYLICEYLYALANALHQLLDTVRIIAAPPDERDARIRLLAVAKRMVGMLLEVLGIEAVERV